MNSKQPEKVPAQHQSRHPGREDEMQPRPRFEGEWYKAADKLKGKVAIITGGDSGIGRAVAIFYAKEGADVVIMYLDSHDDARETKRLVEKHGRKCILIAGDIGDEIFCKEAVAQAFDTFGKIDILVNNAAVQYVTDSIEELSSEQLETTFRTNIFSYFYMTKAVLPRMKPGATIINTTSVTAYKGNPVLVDYASTKGAIVAFTRSLSQQVIKKGVRVNGVAPGPIWTPLIPSSFDEKHVEQFGQTKPIGRPGQPEEVAGCYVFLAAEDSSYMSGQILHPNGGEIING